MPIHVSSTCAHHQEVKIALRSLLYHLWWYQRLRIFISVINQLDAQMFCSTISLFHAYTYFEHMCSSSGCQNCITQPLVSSVMMQFWPPDDKQMCSKHVEAWNKLILKQKFCTSSWLITEINKVICTVSKTSKKKEIC